MLEKGLFDAHFEWIMKIREKWNYLMFRGLGFRCSNLQKYILSYISFEADYRLHYENGRKIEILIFKGLGPNINPTFQDS